MEPLRIAFLGAGQRASYLAPGLRDADEVFRIADRDGLRVEVAEQVHRRPEEQTKLAPIEAGVFGRIHSSFNDFVGHGYHGVRVMRSYLGFDAKPVRSDGQRTGRFATIARKRRTR
jgi:predicted dehydrogenase